MVVRSAVDPAGEVVEVANHAEFLALPQEVRDRARYFLLTHHNDAMPASGSPWLSRRRGDLAPKRRPGARTSRSSSRFMDVKNATNVVPGQFVANGHDYRGSLVRFTSLA